MHSVYFFTLTLEVFQICIIYAYHGLFSTVSSKQITIKVNSGRASGFIHKFILERLKLDRKLEEMNFIRTFESVCWVYIWFIMHTVYGHDLRKRTNGSSNLLVVFGNIGFKMCQKRCMNYADCDGINFKRSGFYCELVKNTTTATFVEDKEFIFSDADTFKVVS